MKRLALSLAVLLTACWGQTEDPTPPAQEPAAATTPAPEQKPAGNATTPADDTSDDSKPAVDRTVDTTPIEVNPLDRAATCEALAQRKPAGSFTSSSEYDKGIIDADVDLRETTTAEGHRYEISVGISSVPIFREGDPVLNAIPAKGNSHTMTAWVTSKTALAAPWAGTFNGGDVASMWFECTSDGNGSGGGTVSNNTETVITITKKTDTTVEGTWLLRGEGGGTVSSQGTFKAPIAKPVTTKPADPQFICCK